MLIPFHGADLKFNWKVVGYFQDVHVIIAPVGMFFQESYCYSSLSLQLGEVGGHITLLELCAAPPSTRKATQQP